MSRTIAVGLSLIMALSPLSACSSASTSQDGEGEETGEELSRSLDADEEEANDAAKQLEYNAEGTYTVSFVEGDLIVLEGEDLQTAQESMAEARANASGQSEDTTEGAKADNKDAAQEEDAKAKAEQTAAALTEAQAALEEAQAKVDAQAGDAQGAEDAQAKLDAAKEATAQAEQAVADAQAALDEASDAVAQADDASRESAEQAQADAQTALDEAQAALDQAMADEADAQAELDAAQATDSDEDAAKALEEAQANYDKAKEADDAAQKALEEAEAKADDEVEEEAAEDADATAFADLAQEDMEVAYSVITNMDEYAASFDENGEPTVELEDEYRLAEVTSFQNENGTIELSFTDPDAAEQQTNNYIVYIAKLKAYYPIDVELPEQTSIEVLSQTEFVSSTSEASEVVLTLEDAEWPESVAIDAITLGGSFKEMSVQDAAVEDGELRLQLSGTPVLEEELLTTYTNGTIQIAADAVEGTTMDLFATVPVEVPNAWVDLDSMQVDGDTISMTVDVNGMDVDGLTAADVDFGQNATVTDVQPTDDGKLAVSLKADTSSEDVEAAADAISNTEITVGEVTKPSNVDHATFDQRFESIEADDDDFTLTIALTAVAGTFAEGISADSVTIGGDFEGGSVVSLTRADDTNAELVLLVPSNGATEDSYNIIGSVTLSEGALVDLWGEASPEKTNSRSYAPENLGRDDPDNPADYLQQLVDRYKDVNGIENRDWDAVDDDTKQKILFDYDIAKMEKDAKDAAKKKQDAWQGTYKEGLNQAVQGFGYAADLMQYVDKDAADIMRYELEGLKALNSVVNGKYMDVVGNAMKILQMAGVLKKQNEPTIADVLQQLDEIKDYISAMNDKLDTMMNQEYRNRLASFEQKLVQAQTECADIEGWQKEARQIAALRKDVKGVSENSSTEEIQEYNKALVDIIKERHDDYLIKRDGLQKLVVSICAEVLADNNTDVLYTYDNLVNNFYNWSTQGYTARNAYRTNILMALSRGFNDLYFIYDLPNSPSDLQGTLATIDKAAQKVQDSSAGRSTVRDNTTWEGFQLGAYSPTLGITVYKNTLWGHTSSGPTITKTQVSEYKNRLHGNSVIGDLTSAGIVAQDFAQKYEKSSKYLGICMRAWRTTKSYYIIKKRPVTYAQVLKWNGSISDKEMIFDANKPNDPKWVIKFLDSEKSF